MTSENVKSSAAINSRTQIARTTGTDVSNQLRSGERALIVLPTKRVRASKILWLLQCNGLSCRTVGRAAFSSGETQHPCALILAVSQSQLRQATRYLSLFGLNFYALVGDVTCPSLKGHNA